MTSSLTDRWVSRCVQDKPGEWRILETSIQVEKPQEFLLSYHEPIVTKRRVDKKKEGHPRLGISQSAEPMFTVPSAASQANVCSKHLTIS